MYDPKTTITGSLTCAGVATAIVLRFVLKHYLQLEFPDEVIYSIIAIGVAILGKFSRDSNLTTQTHDDAAQAVVAKVLADQAAAITQVTELGESSGAGT